MKRIGFFLTRENWTRSDKLRTKVDARAETVRAFLSSDLQVVQYLCYGLKNFVRGFFMPEPERKNPKQRIKKFTVMKKIGLLLCFIFLVGTGFAQDGQWYFDKGLEYANAENYSQAIPYFKKANELAEGNDSACQYNIGLCYDLTGNYTQAVYWWRKAAEQGHATAQYNLGNSYYDGQGVMQDYTQAVYWWRKAAEQGDVDAQYNLGVCYADGQGVTKDLTQAVYWYRKAAEQGVGDAQGALSLCYYWGTGVAIDVEQAKFWGRKAIAHEDTDPEIIKHLQEVVLQ